MVTVTRCARSRSSSGSRELALTSNAYGGRAIQITRQSHPWRLDCRDVSTGSAHGPVQAMAAGDGDAGESRHGGEVDLGRLLFFDPRVSTDGAVSCARCHQPALYGTDALPRFTGASGTPDMRKRCSTRGSRCRCAPYMPPR